MNEFTVPDYICVYTAENGLVVASREIGLRASLRFGKVCANYQADFTRVSLECLHYLTHMTRKVFLQRCGHSPERVNCARIRQVSLLKDAACSFPQRVVSGNENQMKQPIDRVLRRQLLGTACWTAAISLAHAIQQRLIFWRKRMHSTFVQSAQNFVHTFLIFVRLVD